MTPADLRAELETELSWREEELRFFRNRLASLSSRADKERYCKCLVVMLYAHFEGFWKAAFTAYISFINNQKMASCNAVDSLAASSMEDILRALVDSGSKCDFFRSLAPDDTKLHRHARHAEFVGRISEAANREVSLNSDTLVDTESNLTPTVSKKILFRTGFSPDQFKIHDGIINQLIRRRNNIAHGSEKLGIPISDYTQIESLILGLMNSVVIFLFNAAMNKAYLRPSCLWPEELSF